MASKAILKTVITFGLVSIPVRVVSAYNNTSGVSLHWMHAGECGGPVGYSKYCKVCNTYDLTPDQVGNGYQHGDVLIPITDADLEGLPTPSKGRVELVQFVEADSIPASMYSVMYYLEPEPVGRGPYDLLARVLADREVLGIGTITMRSKESLCAIRPESGGALVLETLRRPEELKPPPTLDPTPEPGPELLAAAGMLIDAQTRPFDAGVFTNQYEVALNALIEQKISGTRSAPVAETPAPKQTGDLMAMLRASIDQAKKQQAA